MYPAGNLIWLDAAGTLLGAFRLDFLCFCLALAAENTLPPGADMAQKLCQEFTIRNKLGLHGRAAAKIVRVTNRFQARIRICRNAREADAKSILAILTLSCPQGTRVEVCAEGRDAPEAMAALTVLFDNKFGED